MRPPEVDHAGEGEIAQERAERERLLVEEGQAMLVLAFEANSVKPAPRVVEDPWAARAGRLIYPSGVLAGKLDAAVMESTWLR